MTHALIVGAGHNGLTCAAYLARAGLDVTVVERRDEVGGCASSEHVLGARVNICNCDHSMVRASGIIEDLDLARYGLRYLDLDPALLSITTDGSAPWFAFHDIDRTVASLRLTHPGQADAYRRYVDTALPVARLVVALAAAPPRPGHVARQLAGAPPTAVARLLAWSRRSAPAVLRRWFGDAEALVAPVVAAGPAVWGAHPDQSGTGLGALGPAIRHLVPVGRPVGGSGSLPRALAACASAHGARVRTGAPVAAILTARDRVRGVVLEDGEELDADLVISTVDPRTTFLRWLTDPTPAVAAAIARWRRRPSPDGYEAKLDAVIDTRPTYRAVDDGVRRRLGVDEPLGCTALITPPVAGIAAAHRVAARGGVADQPVMLANVPSVPDPTVAPPGGDLLSLEVLFTPYQLRGGWPATTEPERWLEVYARHLEPGFIDHVRSWRVVGPLDYERQFGLRRGHAPSFAGGPLAALLGQDRELTRYQTPVRGLYLAGAGTYPGAGVWGASGRNAAAVALAAA